MYMFPVSLVPRSRTLRGIGTLHALGETMMMVSKAWCDSKGGSYQDTGGSVGKGYGQQGTCYYTVAAPVAMEAPRPAPAPTQTKISVPTTTQVQVSPQISPVFVQQFQPTGSPVGAGTAMTAAPDPAQTRYYEMLTREREAESKRQTELMDRLLAQQSAAQTPQMTTQFLPGGPEPEEEITPVTGPVPVVMGRAGVNWLPMLLAAGVIGFAVMGKGKAPARRRVKRKAKGK